MDGLAVVNFASITGLPRDSVTNTFALGDIDVNDAAQQASVFAAIQQFYNGVVAATAAAVGNFLSPALSRIADQASVKLYDITAHLDGSPHGSPKALQTFALASNLGIPGLPSEVACVMRIEATGRAAALVEAPDDADAGPEVNRPRQRQTSRVYLGPLTTGTSTTSAAVVPRINNGLRDTILGAGTRLGTALAAVTAGANLGVWSRKDAAVRQAAFIAVDDAFDTQRRRGERPLALTRTAI